MSIRVSAELVKRLRKSNEYSLQQAYRDALVIVMKDMLSEAKTLEDLKPIIEELIVRIE